MSIFDLIDLSGTIIFFSLFLFFRHKRLLFLLLLDFWIVLTSIPFDIPDNLITPIIPMFLDTFSLFSLKLFFIFTLNLVYLTYRQQTKIPKKIIPLLIANCSAFFFIPFLLNLIFSKIDLPDTPILSILFSTMVLLAYPFLPYFGLGDKTLPLLIIINIIVILILMYKVSKQKEQPKKKR